MFALRLENVRPPLFTLARMIARAALPASARAWLYRLSLRIERARRAWQLSTPLIIAPTYADDGLISQHVCDFMRDARFLDAYNWARAGVPWSHPGEMHFRAHVACWAASHAKTIDGDFVECGVGYGILSATICRYLNFRNFDKTFYLYDTFAGIPVQTLEDEGELSVAEKLNASHYQGDALRFLRDRFFSYPNVRLVPGILPDTLKHSAPARISYLSIDLNNAVAEMGTIKHLWGILSPGAVVLLDDYAYGAEFTNQKRAWDAFAATKNIAILTLPTGQGLIIKP